MPDTPLPTTVREAYADCKRIALTDFETATFVSRIRARKIADAIQARAASLPEDGLGSDSQKDIVAALEAEVARLRGALIATCNNIGAYAHPDVSTDFLMHVPEEARKVVARLKGLSPADKDGRS